MKKTIWLLRINIFITFICYLISATSCKKNDLEDKLIGAWSVDINSAIIERNNWQNIYGNTFTLENDFSCSVLPFKNILTDKFYPLNGTWKCFSNNQQDTLIFNVPENPMNGKYEIVFYKDYDRKLLKMKLSNDSLEFTCSKFLQNFDTVRDW